MPPKNTRKKTGSPSASASASPFQQKKTTKTKNYRSSATEEVMDENVILTELSSIIFLDQNAPLTDSHKKSINMYSNYVVSMFGFVLKLNNNPPRGKSLIPAPAYEIFIPNSSANIYANDYVNKYETLIEHLQRFIDSLINDYINKNVNITKNLFEKIKLYLESLPENQKRYILNQRFQENNNLNSDNVIFPLSMIGYIPKHFTHYGNSIDYDKNCLVVYEIIYKITKLLIEHGANVELNVFYEQSYEHGRRNPNLFEEAVYYGNLPFIKAVLETHAIDLNKLNVNKYNHVFMQLFGGTRYYTNNGNHFKYENIINQRYEIAELLFDYGYNKCNVQNGNAIVPLFEYCLKHINEFGNKKIDMLRLVIHNCPISNSEIRSLDFSYFGEHAIQIQNYFEHLLKKSVIYALRKRNLNVDYGLEADILDMIDE